MPYYGIKTGTTSTYEDLKAKTLPPRQYGSSASTSTYNYVFDKFTFTNIYQDSVSLEGLLNPSADASWRIPVKTNFYQKKSDGTYQQYDCVRKGYLPLFRSGSTLSSVISMWTNKKPIHISNGGVQSDLTLTRSSTQLKIGSTTLTTADFVDGVIPVYVAFLVVGSGAGGGCSSGTSGNGTGGGGGGTAFGILNIETNNSLKLHYGDGGFGGYRNTSVSNDDYRYRGGVGETSYVCPSNSTSVSSRFFSGGAGTPGNSSEVDSQGNAGGAGETKSEVIYPLTQRGGRGGGKGEAGGGSTVMTYLLTATSVSIKSTNASARLNMSSPAQSGGTSGNSATGGGGASTLGAGGNGGTTASNGSSGGTAAGGGGGRWTFGTWKTGGAGGDGMIMIFY